MAEPYGTCAVLRIMARATKQVAVGGKLAADEAELHKAIGEFIFWFSQLEFTIKARLSGALALGDGLFDIIIGPYDFAMLCTVTENVLRKDAAADVAKRVTDYFNRCRKLNQQTRIIVAHGSWTLDGVRHVSRNTLEADFHFKKPEDLRKQADAAKKLMYDLFSLGAYSPLREQQSTAIATYPIHALRAERRSDFSKLIDTFANPNHNTR